jgi:hypothetical protein
MLTACATRAPEIAPTPCKTIIPQSILDVIASEDGGRAARVDASGLRGRIAEDRDAEWEGAFSSYEASVTLPLVGLIADGNRCTAQARARD